MIKIRIRMLSRVFPFAIFYTMEQRLQEQRTFWAEEEEPRIDANERESGEGWRTGYAIWLAWGVGCTSRCGSKCMGRG